MDSNDKIKSVGINIQEKANLIWNVANSLFGAYKPHEYGLVILPMVVIKRFHDCLLPTREKVLAKYMKTLHINQREGLSMVIIAHSAWTRYIDLMAQGRIVYREGLLFRKDELDTAQT